MLYDNRLKKSEWFVASIELEEAQALIREHHYARGGSNTRVYCHGLYSFQSTEPKGVAWWLPPTRVAAESVNREAWKQVLSLTRLVVVPGVPKNAASFMLARSIQKIRDDGRFISLVTYADERQGHTGGIYRASGWEYAGRTGPYPCWLDASGKQVARKSTTNRTDAQMRALGHQFVGSFYKHKFVMHLKAQRAIQKALG